MRSQCRRNHAVLMIVSACIAVLTQSAHVAQAANEPVLRTTYPAAGAVVRSADVEAVSVIASFDRDLSNARSTFTLSSATGAVPGSKSLSGPVSDTGGQRALAFHPATRLTETGNPYAASVVACPPSGSCSTVTFSFRIDDTAPLAPVVVSPAEGELRRDQPIVVRGTAEGASTVTIWEGVEIARTTAHSDGVWIVQLPYGAEDGVAHSISVFATDIAGNRSAPTVRSFVHDSVDRVPTISEPAQNAMFATTWIRVRGTAKPGSSVRVAEGGIARDPAVLADADGRWSVELTFTEGSHVITATSTDQYGTVDGPSEARTFAVDVTAPAVPTITAPAEGSHLRTAAVAITGTAEPRATVRIREGGVLRGQTQADGAGGWTTTLTFTDGPHTIVAEAVDAAGNVGPPATRAFVVDTAAPAPPRIDQPLENGVVASTSVTVSGIAEPGVRVRIIEAATVIGSTSTSNAGTWSITLTFLEGTHTIRALAVDAAENESLQSGPRSFTVDTTPPPVPVIATPAEGATFTTFSVRISGTAEPFATVDVFEGPVVIGFATADGQGIWTLTRTFANGAHTIAARATDRAGNVGGLSAPRTFTVSVSTDTTPPDPPAIIDPEEGALVGGEVIVRGVAEPFATINLIEDGIRFGGASAGGSGSWSVLMRFTDGEHRIVATASDRAGNESAASPIRTFTVDAGRPNISFAPGHQAIFVPPLVPVAMAGSANDVSGVARVEWEATDRITNLRTSGTATCSTCPATEVSWSVAPELGPGMYNFSVTAVDVVGNRSLPVAMLIIVL